MIELRIFVISPNHCPDSLTNDVSSVKRLLGSQNLSFALELNIELLIWHDERLLIVTKFLQSLNY